MLQFLTQGADVEFTCQHGPNECYGNKVHACAIQNIQVSTTTFLFHLTLENIAKCSNGVVAHFSLSSSGKFIPEYKDTWIAYIRLCGLFDAQCINRKGCSIPGWKMRSWSEIGELACDSWMCQFNGRQQIATGPWCTHSTIESTTYQCPNHHVQPCEYSSHYFVTWFLVYNSLNSLLRFSTANRQWFDGSWLQRFESCRVPCYAWTKTIWMSSTQFSRNS